MSKLGSGAFIKKNECTNICLIETVVVMKLVSNAQDCHLLQSFCASDDKPIYTLYLPYIPYSNKNITKCTQTRHHTLMIYDNYRVRHNYGNTYLIIVLDKKTV